MNREDLLRKFKNALAVVAKEQQEADRLRNVIQTATRELREADALIRDWSQKAESIERTLADLDSCDWENCEATATWKFTSLALNPVRLGAVVSKSCFEHMTCFAGPNPTMIEEITR